jgi:hypothetical protein
LTRPLSGLILQDHHGICEPRMAQLFHHLARDDLGLDGAAQPPDADQRTTHRQAGSERPASEWRCLGAMSHGCGLWNLRAASCPGGVATGGYRGGCMREGIWLTRVSRLLSLTVCTLAYS